MGRMGRQPNPLELERHDAPQMRVAHGTDQSGGNSTPHRPLRLNPFTMPPRRLTATSGRRSGEGKTHQVHGRSRIDGRATRRLDCASSRRARRAAPLAAPLPQRPNASFCSEHGAVRARWPRGPATAVGSRRVPERRRLLHTVRRSVAERRRAQPAAASVAALPCGGRAALLLLPRRSQGDLPAPSCPHPCTRSTSYTPPSAPGFRHGPASSERSQGQSRHTHVHVHAHVAPPPCRCGSHLPTHWR
jgi:hypothetical protein